MNTPQSEAPGNSVSRIEALGFRSLRYVSQGLGPFHVLVGPNASGKSTFLDVLAFLGDLQRVGLERAVTGSEAEGVPLRATNPRHLTWMRGGKTFELAVEAPVPLNLRAHLNDESASVCRYEITVDVSEPLRIAGETLWLKPNESSGTEYQRIDFPNPPAPPDRIVIDPEKRAPARWRRVISRGGKPDRVTFYPDASRRSIRFYIEGDKSALVNLPADEQLTPVASWFRQILAAGIQRIALSGEAMRRTSSPTRADTYLPDGSNLPHIVDAVAIEHPDRHADWLRHVREALPDIDRITVRMQPWDGHRYLVVHYRSGLEAPPWLVSEGTLRFLALTLLAYLPNPTGPYLVEEPENGIHPGAVETVIESLSSVYEAQILLATHSPAIASLATVDQMLCFARNDECGTDVVAGSSHPRLGNWPGAADLGMLHASGVLG